MSKELKKLFNEIEGKLQPEISEEAGGAKAITPYVIRKPRKMSPQRRKTLNEEFVKVAVNREQTLTKIENLQKQLAISQARLQKLVEKHGVGVRERDLALYAHPFKGQMIYRRMSGSIDAEIVREHAVQKGITDLFILEEEKLDLKKLENFLHNTDMPGAVRKHLLSTLDQFRQIGRSPACAAIEADEILDLVKYDEMKSQGLLPKALIEKAEKVQWSQGSLRIDRIKSAKNKCSECASVLPKENHEGNRVCSRCGTVHSVRSAK